MAITPYRGKFHVEFYPKTASTAFAFNEVVKITSTGYLTQLADDSSELPVGLILKTIASTDSDYASNTMVPVLVGEADSEYLCDIGTGTGAVTYVGLWVDADGTYDATKIDVSSSTYDVWLVTKYISTTQAVCKMAKLTDPRPDSIVD